MFSGQTMTALLILLTVSMISLGVKGFDVQASGAVTEFSGSASVVVNGNVPEFFDIRDYYRII